MIANATVDAWHTSPFSPVLGPVAAELPVALRDQYLLSASAGYSIVLEGTMSRIWHRPGWLWPFLWFLTVPNILFPETGTDILARMAVDAGVDRNGHAYQTWRRTFSFARPRRFDAVMIYDDVLMSVTERFGRAGLLQIVWNVVFRAPATIEISTRACLVSITSRRLTVPSWLSIHVAAEEWAEAGRDDVIGVRLRATLPVIGTFFGYEGRFVLRREVLA